VLKVLLLLHHLQMRIILSHSYFYPHYFIHEETEAQEAETTQLGSMKEGFDCKPPVSPACQYCPWFSTVLPEDPGVLG
jgi:hypothetical protein